jgi:hypothetical protein
MTNGTRSVTLVQLKNAQGGTNERLDALLAEQKRTNQLLEWLGAVLGHPQPGST